MFNKASRIASLLHPLAMCRRFPTLPVKWLLRLSSQVACKSFIHLHFMKDFEECTEQVLEQELIQQDESHDEE